MGVLRSFIATWLPVLALYLMLPALALVIWGELTPHPPDLNAPDKFLHFTAYFGLASIATCALRGRRAALYAVVALIVLGGALEILQMYTGRDAEWLDELANACGALTGCLVALGLLRLVGAIQPD